MARRRKDRTENGSGAEASGTGRVGTHTRTDIPSAYERISKAMSMVQKTTPGVYSPGQSKMSRVPSIPKAALPERKLETPGEAWDKAQNRVGEVTVNQHTPKDQRLDQRQCKGKPRSNKGNGTSRKYVPWCK